MFKKRFRQNVFQRASATAGYIGTDLRQDTSSNEQDADGCDLSTLARNYRRMHQVIIILIAGVFAYLIGHLAYDAFLVRDGSLFLKLPENASTL